MIIWASRRIDPGFPGSKERALTHRSIRKLALYVAAATAAVAGVVSVPASADAATYTVHGCPSGYLCVYPQNAGWNGDRPSLKYYSYGYHNIHNQYGTHRVLNNQYGGAYAWLCPGYNGTASGPYEGMSQDHWGDYNLTPINSIVLSRTYYEGCAPA
jgi:hypothetical protein